MRVLKFIVIRTPLASRSVQLA